MEYSIIIPTYNHCDDLLKPCVESIIKYTDLSKVELIIIANGCTDETQGYLTYLVSYFQRIGLADNIQLGVNSNPLGFAGAINAGLQIARGQKIILLNNDCILLEQYKNRWIDLLNKPFNEDPTCGISCVSKHRSPEAGVDFAIFFCVMIDRKVFDTIGALNEEYGMGGGEDTEFCIEAERNGFTVRECVGKQWSTEGNLFVGDFPIYHRGEGTVHDTTLVPNYHKTFRLNGLKLAKKYNPEYYRFLLSNNYERAVFLKGDPILPRESARYRWAAENIYGNTVLEIGCSTGYGVQFLPENVQYTGLDYDDIIISVAREQQWRPDITFLNENIDKLDIIAQRDTIIAFEVIEHLENGLEIVERLKKYCKRLLITVPWMEIPGFWGHHHKLHMLNESMFPGFEFQYIDEWGNILDHPVNGICLMVCKYDSI